MYTNSGGWDRNKLLVLLIAILLLRGCADNKSAFALNNRHYIAIDLVVTDLKKFDEFFALETQLLKKYNSNVAMDIRSKDQKKRNIILSFPDRETADNFD